MQSFEFVMILVSIVIGLGVAELLGMLARILRNEARGGSLHTLWIIAVLLTLVQIFWAEWQLQFRSDWSLLELIIFLAPAFLLFLAASLLCPRTAEPMPLDAYFLERRKPFYLVLLAFLLSASIESWVFLDRAGAYDIVSAADGVRAALMIMCIALVLSSTRRVHLWGALIWIVTVVGFAMRFTFSLSRMSPSG